MALERKDLADLGSATGFRDTFSMAGIQYCTAPASRSCWRRRAFKIEILIKCCALWYMLGRVRPKVL
jgi:hypothetical protein